MRGAELAGVRYGRAKTEPCGDGNEQVNWGIPAWEPNYRNVLGESELDIGHILTHEIDPDAWHLLTIELGMRAATHLILDTYDLAAEHDFHRVNGFYRFE